MNSLNILRGYLFSAQIRNNRRLSLSILRRCSTNESEELGENIDENEEEKDDKKRKVKPEKDRSRVIPVETSIEYMNSSAYFEAYGNELVWKLYRRNHKWATPKLLTRNTCIMNKVVTCGSPCPICRDEYLVLDYRNLQLLKQFISPHTDEAIDAYFTSLCQKKHFELLVEIEKARDYGLLPFFIPKRMYNYEDYYPKYKAIAG